MADQRTSSSSSSRRAKTGDDVVGQFIIGSEIGKGSFAQVYSGKHKVCCLPPSLVYVNWPFAHCSVLSYWVKQKAISSIVSLGSCTTCWFLVMSHCY